MRNHFTRVFLFIVVISAIANVNAMAGYEETVPPEILRRYDPEIVKNQRPVVVRITQPMIWGLREQPDQGGDVYSFDLDPAKVSSVQRDIIRNWVRQGQKVLFWGKNDAERYTVLFDDVLFAQIPSGGRDNKRPQLSRHVVNTDVSDLDFSWESSGHSYLGYARITKFPPESEPIVTKSDGIVAGRIPYGRGSIYVALMANHWNEGKDRDRWILNFRQWMLGHRVPGAAETALGTGTGESKPDASPPQDRLLLKNGDTISGQILVKKFTVKTSYADLSFDPKQVETVVLEGAGQNIELLVLRTGDKLSGVVGPEKLKVKLIGGQETEIEKDKIKEIVLQH